MPAWFAAGLAAGWKAMAGGAADGAALARVRERGLVGRAREPDRERRRHDADLGQDAADLLDPTGLAAEQVLVRHLDVLEDDLARARGAHGQLVDRLSPRDPRHRLPL